MDSYIFLGVIALVALIAFVVIGVILTKLYTRASKEKAFVRTGAGGQKVVKDGGAVVLPVFHEIIPVNMQTLRLEVQRQADKAIITKDRLRVDVAAAFFVKVKPDDAAIAMAAQTLGHRTMDSKALAGVVEDKFVDALRSVAAQMEMNELHEKRSEFVQQVQNTVAEDLAKNGLQLESVSLTSLDQTDVKYLNPNNTFDAEALAKITAVVQSKARERNEIERNTEVAIAQKDMEATKQSLTIRQQQEFARLEQEREVETRKAAQEADLAKQRAEQKRQAELAVIEQEQAVEAARVQKVQAVEKANIEAAQALKIAEQTSNIAVAERSKAQSEAQAEADLARADAVRAAEAVKTAEAEAKAEREKRVAVIEAEKEAQKGATKIRVQAEAEFEAADKQAQAKIVLANADAKTYEVEAAGKRALAEAANTMSPEQVNLQIKLAVIDALPKIMQEMAAPMKSVDGVKLINVGGIGATTGADGVQGGLGAHSFADAMLGMKLRSPLVEALGKEVGVDLTKGLAGLSESLNEHPAPEAAAEALPAPEVTADTTAQEVDEIRALAGIKK